MKKRPKYDRSKVTKRAWEHYRRGIEWREAMKLAWGEEKGQVVRLPFQGGRKPTVIDSVSRQSVSGRQGGGHLEFQLLSGHGYHLSWPKAGTLYQHLNVECLDRGIRVA